MTELLLANPDICAQKYFQIDMKSFLKLNSKLAVNERLVESLMGSMVYYQSVKPDCPCEEARICTDDSLFILLLFSNVWLYHSDDEARR